MISLFLILYLFFASVAIVSSIESVELSRQLTKTLSKQTYEKMYPVWIMTLLVMLLVNVGFVFEEFLSDENLYRYSMISAMTVFIATMFVVRKRVVSVGVLTGVTEKLKTEIALRTSELKDAKTQLEEYSKSLEKMVEERTLNLQEKVEELTEARTALINMMEDVEATNKFLLEAVEKLKEVDRMKDQLLSNVSHELRTPITIVKSALELMLDDGVTEDQGGLISMAKNNLNRLDILVGDLLYFSSGQRGIPEDEIEKLSLKEIIEEAAKGMNHVAEANGLSIKTSVGKGIPMVHASRSRLLQVFNNLIGNGIKFNKEKGVIRLEASYKEGDEEVNISVSDTGIGIPRKNLPRIFDRFYQVDGTTSRKYGGTGLGLAITKSVIDAHGGKIWADSQPGKGTTFYFTLPIKRKKGYIVTLPLGEREQWQ